jgi:hypothetical protein
MSKRSSKSSDGIERLLDERRKTGEWILRLSDPADESPAHVRDRVRQGYQKRMDEVTEELQGRGAELEKSLLAKAEQRSELAAKARRVKERLEEAQVRRSVGEFDDAQWSELRSEVQGELDELRDELKAVESDISGLKELLGSQQGSAKSPKAGAEAGPEKTAAQQDPSKTGSQPVGAYLKRAEQRQSGMFSASGRPSSPAQAKAELATKQPPRSKNGKSGSTPTSSRIGKVGAPANGKTEATGKKGTRQPSGPSGAVDELAFLKSVTDDEVQGPSPKRASGSHMQQAAAPTAPSAPAPKKPVAPSARTPTKQESATAISENKNDAQTFKCGSCDAPNPATAWYCEKCGAELTV